MSEEKPRLPVQEGVKTENEHIDLKVAGQDGSAVCFRIKRHTPLGKLMRAYCCRQEWSSCVPPCHPEQQKDESPQFLNQFLSLELPMPLLYAERRNLSMKQIMFLFDGQPIKEADTPAELEMEHEDTIEVYQQQTGGGC